MNRQISKFITKQTASASNKAFSRFEVKNLDDGSRVLKGIASTPTPDRAGDTVVPEGIQFETPFPLLWQHDPSKPIGTVNKMTITVAGAEVEATIAPAGTAAYIDEAYNLIKAGLVPGLSIGFRTIDAEYDKATGGFLIKSCELFELSAVTIPANADAAVQSIKAHDKSRVGVPVVRLSAPIIKESDMTIAQQLAALTKKRADHLARQKALMDGAAADGARTLNENEAKEYDQIGLELKSLDTHEARLKEQQAIEAKSAVPVAGGPAVHSPVIVKPNVTKGTAFTRYAIALARSKGNLMQAAEIAKQWKDSTPEVEIVLKAAVAAGTTTDPAWAGPLVQYQDMAAEFIELLRPATIVGRIEGMRRVPFNVRVPGQTTGSSVGWVGEGKPAPVSALAFNTTTLGFSKVAGIVAITEELARFSTPSAEGVIQQDLISTISQFLDQQFIDPAVAAGANGLSPASITNGVKAIPASGKDAAAVRADVKKVFQAYIAANLSVAGAVWIMSETTALSLSLMLNVMGQPEFPGLTMAGGTFFGLPAILSQTVGDNIVLAKASEILFADDGGVTLDVSREASLQMDSAPVAGATELVSLWQNGFIAMKAERFINWKRRRVEGVQYISGAAYGDAAQAG
ncbi:phage major capsid protein [Burkholderia thailandensis]|uniref:Phage major capsid protein, HK97 family n=1 Tax=Burkholderia thailandensis TaxID=57975 RepID=A0AAW9D1I9_BURTH|nr:phage major capsid protein [Burkholderia thailandensis]MCS3390256.1 phage major capsid protein [Burkholderia thailandensis]MCS6425802.1 phage major capsid protein [Burkholderia thailandensis]MCS6454218.1 phage major capsid protein [Burkholderia thailandensis]MCS6462456.1 phage major capsid protein [Burkholderia thailandensis]MCS6483274.1 phage major capsid protein [Burkholderia thailandensis]